MLTRTGNYPMVNPIIIRVLFRISNKTANPIEAVDFAQSIGRRGVWVC